jgi:penicillin-binding protein 1A
MFDLLKGPTGPGGTAPNARFGSMPVAGKTGTSGDKQDFWFCGLTPYLSGAVWLGNDKPKTYESGLYSSTSAGIWQKIMAEAHKNLPVKQIEEPSGIVKAEVCKVSGKIPTDLCAKDPRGSQVVTEMFIEGTQPTALCDVHVEAKVNKQNGKLATEYTPKDLVESRIFIKRDYTPTQPLSDQKYVLPTEVDDSKPADNPPTTTGDDNSGNTDTGTGTINNPGIPVPDPKNKSH